MGANALIFGVAAALVLAAGLVCAQDILRELRAPRLEAVPIPPQTGPLVSVLIPARDEAERLGGCLSGLTRQTYQNFELVVVDDHSSDGTGDLARSYGGRIPGLQVRAGAALPPGWAGKCWACWQAAGAARGTWLLFLDADVEPAPGLLAALVARAERRRADLITLMPLLRMGSLAEWLLLPAFHSILYGVYPLDRVSDPRARLAFANGQCILIRASVYEAVGGHAAVRGSVLEDTELGQRVKASGYRLEAAAARDLLEVRMYTGWPSVAEGLGKNAVAGYRSGGTRSALVGARQALLAFGPLALLAAALWAALAQPGWPLATALLLHALGLWLLASATYAWLYRRRYRSGALWALAYPLGLAIYFGLALRALIRIRHGQGVSWKGRNLAG